MPTIILAPRLIGGGASLHSGTAAFVQGCTPAAHARDVPRDVTVRVRFQRNRNGAQIPLQALLQHGPSGKITVGKPMGCAGRRPPRLDEAPHRTELASKRRVSLRTDGVAVQEASLCTGGSSKRAVACWRGGGTVRWACTRAHGYKRRLRRCRSAPNSGQRGVALDRACGALRGAGTRTPSRRGRMSSCRVASTWSLCRIPPSHLAWEAISSTIGPAREMRTVYCILCRRRCRCPTTHSYQL